MKKKFHRDGLYPNKTCDRLKKLIKNNFHALKFQTSCMITLYDYSHSLINFQNTIYFYNIPCKNKICIFQSVSNVFASSRHCPPAGSPTFCKHPHDFGFLFTIKNWVVDANLQSPKNFGSSLWIKFFSVKVKCYWKPGWFF